MTFLIYEFGKSINSPASAPRDGNESSLTGPEDGAPETAVPAAIASSMSALIILPSGPVPLILV